jgi:hypothetical protein
MKARLRPRGVIAKPCRQGSASLSQYHEASPRFAPSHEGESIGFLMAQSE